MTLQAQLTQDMIRDIAFKTTGQRDNPAWKEHRLGKLTASLFGKAISAMENRHPSNLQHLREDIYNPPKLDYLAPIKWGIEHESIAIQHYTQLTGVIVKPTGLWLYPNGIFGASPDGLIYETPHATNPAGIIEVKCPYSMRNVKLLMDEWHYHLKYLDINNKLKQFHQYYHQVQGTMVAVNVPWCDFVIWTPNNMKIMRIHRDSYWEKKYIAKLEDFYQDEIVRTEERAMDCSCTTDDEEDVYELSAERDLTAIRHPIGSAEQQLRNFMIQSFQIHMTRYIYKLHSDARSGKKWKTAVGEYWESAVRDICEACIRKIFMHKWRKYFNWALRDQIRDVVDNIMLEDQLWSRLLFDPDFARIVRTRIMSYEPTLTTKEPYCTCSMRYQSQYFLLYKALI